MGIQKQEFYEGAALHQLVRNSSGVSLRYASPVFVMDARVQLYLKYSAGKRSPWGFTFTPEEQKMISDLSAKLPLVIGLICGADGVVAVPCSEYDAVAGERETAIRISCYRRHREHFEVIGPNGTISRKIASSDWRRI